MTPEATQVWRHTHITNAADVTTVRFHTDEGPLVWSAEVHEELANVWASLSRLDETKVILLTGTGDVFCDSIESSAHRPWIDIWAEGRRLVTGLLELPVPVVALVNGPATIHSEIAVMADIVLASGTAEFADRAHITRGYVPGDGIQIVWQRLLGPTRASHFLLTGQSIDATEALRLGVVHEVLPASELESRGRQIAGDLSQLPAEVLRYTRSVLRMADREAVHAQLSHGLALEGLARSHHPTAGSEAQRERRQRID